MKTSNRVKNILKKLRTNGSPLLPTTNKENKTKKNFYECLEILYDEEDFETDESVESNKKVAVIKQNNLDINRLPEEMLNIILGYLPMETRIAVLKCKYNKKKIQTKLTNMPKTEEKLKKLFKCASVAKEVLKFVLKSESDVFKNFALYATENFKKEKELNAYYQYYKENFTKLILAAIRHYTRFYKKPLIKEKKCNCFIYVNDIRIYVSHDIHNYGIKKYNLNKKIIEETIFRLYAQLILI